MERTTPLLASKLIKITENYFLKRKQKKAILKILAKRKGFLRDWLEAFLWAAMVVLVINQYFLQAYFIPSASMNKTLVEGDRIFVDKFSYGPEILPGVGKLQFWDTPSRGEVISFNNPDYQSYGTFFSIVQRTLYMLTLSLVDIDKEKSNYSDNLEPRKALLIKRVIGEPREQWRKSQTEFYIKTSDQGWLSESEFKTQSGLKYTNWERPYGISHYESNIEQTEKVFKLAPSLMPNRTLSLVFNGYYIPDGFILPLGDNRTNSHDGRFFGPVAIRDVLGHAQFVFWPGNGNKAEPLPGKFGIIQ